MPASWEEGFAAVQDMLYGPQTLEGSDPANRKEIEHASDPDRRVEAASVEPVAQAFATAEIERGLGAELGIYGRPNLVPPLHDQLSKQLRKADERQLDLARDALLGSLANGYLGFVAIEHILNLAAADVPPERIWAVSVSSFRGQGLRRLGLPNSFIETVEQQSHQLLVERLRSAGVLGRREKKVGLLGRYYGHAGAFMRAAQVEADVGQEVNSLAEIGQERWPYLTFVGR